MVLAEVNVDEERPLVVASMFGNTTECVNAAKTMLEANGYEVLVFHATGTGGRARESLIESGLVALVPNRNWTACGWLASDEPSLILKRGTDGPRHKLIVTQSE